MKIEIDLTTVKEIKPLTGGVYILVIKNCKQKQSKQDLPKLSWETEVAEPAESRGEKFFFDTSLAPDALFHLKNLVEATGIKFTPQGFDAADLFGKRVGAVVAREETVEFGERNRVSRFLNAKETKAAIDPKDAAKRAKSQKQETASAPPMGQVPSAPSAPGAPSAGPTPPSGGPAAVPRS